MRLALALAMMAHRDQFSNRYDATAVRGTRALKTHSFIFELFWDEQP